MERNDRKDIQAWMTRLADGDRAAFDLVFAALWPLLSRFTSRALNGSADADDAAQTALLKAFANIDQLDRDRDAVTWVLGIAAYECRTLRRKQQRRAEVSDVALEATPGASSSPTPEDTLMMRDLEAAALSVMGTLSPADIETLHAMIHDGPRAVSATTFRKRLQRAIERLRAAWSKSHDTE